MKTYSKLASARRRRINALDRLSTQLGKGTKHSKEGVVPLTEKDRSRIEAEMETIHSRI